MTDTPGFDAILGASPRQPEGRPRRARRRRIWPWIVIPLAVILAVGGSVAAYGWINYEKQVRDLLGWELVVDYEGDGNGSEVDVTIASGQIGLDVATTLVDSGVIMTVEALYDLLLEREAAGDAVVFIPGTYRLEEHMSAVSALAALEDPAHRIENTVTIPEGSSYERALDLIAAGTGIPIEDLQAAAADYAAFGLPADALSLEGFLFPATYPFDPGTSAQDALQRMVDEMFERLDALGVTEEDRLEILIKASIVQREAGPNPDDLPKIARVFQNRLDQGWRLQSDATVAYGTGRMDSVWTSPEERADASNEYNTYANDGLPIGPIGLPGEAALDAAVHPIDGPWMFFVPVNLRTGETVFSVTAAEHDAAAQQLYAWCRAPENAAYCE